MTTNQLIKKFGKPNITGVPYLTTIQLPYPMRLAWDLDVSVTRMSCHKDVANDFKNVFDDLLYYYGLEHLKSLEIDLFGGCFNYRKKRNGTSWSTHAWAIAIDLNPAKNGLKTKWADAQFSQPEYQPMIDIFYANNFISYGVEYDFDAMHFEHV